MLLVPALTTAVVLTLGHARGPWWLGSNYDPDYAYLLNGLNIAEGAPPKHTDHPGTPVQLLAAAGIWLAHGVTAPGDVLRMDVLTRPEFFLTVLNGGLMALYALVSAVFGWCAYRYTGSVPCAIGAQLAPVLALVSLTALCRVAPEPLLLVITVGLSAVTLAWLREARSAGRARYPIAAGALIGLAVASKVTFLPVGLAWFFVAGNVRARLALLASAAAAFGAAVFPIRHDARRTLEWFARLALHSEHYGRGEPTVLDVAAYPGAVWRVVAFEPVYTALVLASAVVLAMQPRASRHPAAPGEKEARRALLGVVLAQALQFAMVAKDPTPRYLVPGIALLGLNVALAFRLAGVLRPALRHRVAVATLAAILAGGVIHGVPRTMRLHDRWTDGQARRLELYGQAREMKGARVVVYYGSTSPAVALAFGDLAAGYRYAPRLRQLFPDTVTYTMHRKRYHLIGGGRPVPLDDVRAWARSGRLVFQGPRHPFRQANAAGGRAPYEDPDDTLPPAFQYEVLHDAGDEGLFKAHPR